MRYHAREPFYSSCGYPNTSGWQIESLGVRWCGLPRATPSRGSGSRRDVIVGGLESLYPDRRLVAGRRNRAIARIGPRHRLASRSFGLTTATLRMRQRFH